MTDTFDDKGTTGTAGAVGAAVLIAVAGFLMTGTSAMVPMGAAVTALVGDDIPVTMSTTGPVPLLGRDRNAVGAMSGSRLGRRQPHAHRVADCAVAGSGGRPRQIFCWMTNGPA